MKKKKRPVRSWVLLALIIIAALFFRLYDFENRTQWNVEQSLSIWHVKKVLVDHEITLIGQHFFSLVNGAVYRTPFYNWIFSAYYLVVGFSVKNWILAHALLAVLSMVVLADTAKRVNGMKAWWLVLITYAFSWHVIRIEMVLWHVSLMVVLTSVVLWFEFAGWKSKWKNWLQGLALGFGFSLHFVVIWLIAGLWGYWVLVEGKTALKRILISGSAIGLMLMPLVLFNFRHDFIMNQGIANMLTGRAVETNPSFSERLEIVSSTVPCSVGGAVADTCNLAWIIPTVILGVVLLWRGAPKLRKYLVFLTIQVVVGIIGIMFAGRLEYSSRHYIIYLLPMLIFFKALLLTEIFKKRWGSLLVVGVVIVFLFNNLGRFNTFKLNDSYFDKRELVKYVFSWNEGKRVGVKFWDQHTLAYDFVFWEVAREKGIPYERVNLIEKWGSDEPDMYIYLNENPDGVKGNVLNFGKNKLLVLEK